MILLRHIDIIPFVCYDCNMQSIITSSDMCHGDQDCHWDAFCNKDRMCECREGFEGNGVTCRGKNVSVYVLIVKAVMHMP